jgi:hypothetical protein
VQSTLTPTNSGLVKESSSSAVPNSGAAPAGNRSREDDGLDMLDVGKLEKEQELLNSLIGSGFKKGKAVVPGGERVDISVPDQGTASISLTSSDSSSSSSSKGFDSGSKSKMVAAMQAVVKAAKKKKKFKQFHSFAELSRWLLKRVCKLDTLEAVHRTNDLVVVLSDLNKKMGFQAKYAYVKAFLKEEKKHAKKLKKGENVTLLPVDCFDPYIFTKKVFPLMTMRLCQNGKQDFGASRYCKQKRGSNRGACFKCGAEDHWANSCLQKKKTSEAVPPAPSTSGGKSRAQNPSRCSKCGGSGHSHTVCPSS